MALNLRSPAAQKTVAIAAPAVRRVSGILSGMGAARPSEPVGYLEVGDHTLELQEISLGISKKTQLPFFAAKFKVVASTTHAVGTVKSFYKSRNKFPETYFLPPIKNLFAALFPEMSLEEIDEEFVEKIVEDSASVIGKTIYASTTESKNPSYPDTTFFPIDQAD